MVRGRPFAVAMLVVPLLGWLPTASPRYIQQASPEPLGSGESATIGAIADRADTLPRLRSLLVSRRGALVLERYYHGFGTGRLANVKSVSKSIISALVGVAIARGFIPGVDRTLGEYFPSLLADPTHAAKRSITVEDLLTMRSGLESTSSRNYGRWVRSPNWVRFTLAQPLEASPGTTMEYSTGNTHLLSAMLTKATKQSTRQFAQEALATPLGFTLASWPRDPQGIYFGGYEMLLTPRQMMAFGEMYRQRGSVAGRQIVPASWVDASFVPRARSRWSEQVYGYGWWIRPMLGRSAYYAWGFGGQFIVIVPELALVVVTTSAATADDGRRGHRDAVWELIEQVVGAAGGLGSEGPERSPF